LHASDEPRPGPQSLEKKDEKISKGFTYI